MLTPEREAEIIKILSKQYHPKRKQMFQDLLAEVHRLRDGTFDGAVQHLAQTLVQTQEALDLAQKALEKIAIDPFAMKVYLKQDDRHSIASIAQNALKEIRHVI